MIDRHVSVTLNTVRDVDPWRGGKDVVLCLAEDLAAQTMPHHEIEMVVVDGLYAYRAAELEPELAKMPFRVTHVPPRPTAMVRDGRVAISAYKNTAAVHARGRLLVCTDDLSTLDPGYVARAWTAWNSEHLLLAALTARMDGELNDSRTMFLGPGGRCVGPLRGNVMEPPQYGFCAVPMEAVLRVNGWDEYYDGGQGLEDADFGIRLQKAGYRVALDTRHRVRLSPSSTGWDKRLFPGPVEIVHCCQTTFRIQLEAGHVRANARAWSEKEWGYVAPRCRHLVSDRCGLNGHLCPYLGVSSDREHPSLRLLRSEPPIFDLGELRRQAGNAD